MEVLQANKLVVPPLNSFKAAIDIAKYVLEIYHEIIEQPMNYDKSLSIKW